MKNFIEYYYNINVVDYRKLKDKIVFKSSADYELIKYNNNIGKLLEVYNILAKYNLYCHKIILNRDNSLLTYYSGSSYILIEKNVCDEHAVTLDYILNYDISINYNKKVEWKVLWQDKMDYYEKQISEFGTKYKKIRESFNYYCGLCETAISLLNYVDYKNVRMNITHNRIFYKEKIEEFTNPLNIVIDNITRDIAEYIKFSAIYGEIDEHSIIKYMDEIRLSNSEYILLLARLLYPSYYFDLYDSIIQGKNSENDLEKIIKKSNSYELLLKKLYTNLKGKTRIPPIEWLHNSNYF